MVVDIDPLFFACILQKTDNYLNNIVPFMSIFFGLGRVLTCPQKIGKRENLSISATFLFKTLCPN